MWTQMLEFLAGSHPVLNSNCFLLILDELVSVFKALCVSRLTYIKVQFSLDVLIGQ